MTDNIKLPPMPKPHTPPVFATAANTQSVKAGYELGGYEKTPPLFDEHQLEAYAREAVRLNAQAQQPLKDKKEALDLLNAENARLTKLVLAYRGQRNPHHLAEKISDMMTYAGCSLTEYQQSVLAAGLRALLETREDELESNG